jgi:hypothetical protein
VSFFAVALAFAADDESAILAEEAEAAIIETAAEDVAIIEAAEEETAAIEAEEEAD